MSLTEGTDVVVNLIAEYVWGYEDELKGVFSEKKWDLGLTMFINLYNVFFYVNQ